ncbi:ABC transporter ATP-binding protein [Aquipuribacter hungaricus]|uniref:ABC transporter ATP-binding protein n=1 Tax=Aquipuribacter hungaricus TaxID=545624 RepID=A0ABV7WKC0_9MICO
MMNDAVVGRGVHVRRGRTDALADVDLDVPRGAVLGLLGPSGCGKTTLMRAVVGVQRGVQGSLRVLGRPAGTPGLRSRVGYLTQGASVYDDLSVAQNLRYAAAVHGLRGRAAGAAVARVLDQVDLDGHAGRRAGSLSGGQRSRVGLAVVLLPEPELLVLDEPTVGLDPVLRRDLWALFARLAAGGTTLLVSSHVMDEAARCDRLVLLRGGRVLAEGSHDELLARTGARDVEEAFLALVEDTVPA